MNFRMVRKKSLQATENLMDFGGTQSFMITPAHIQQIIDLGINAVPDKLEVTFDNICDNADNQGDNQQIEPGDLSNCTGTVSYGEKQLSEWRPTTVEWAYSTGKTGTMTLIKDGKCKCGIGTRLTYTYPTYTDKTRKFGGLRIQKMEDVDENNISNVYEYKYGKYENGVFIPCFKLNQPYNFSTVIKRYVRQLSDGGGSGIGDPGNGEPIQVGSTFEKYYRIHNSSQANNSYGSSDIVTYPSVIEITGKGQIIREYEDYTSSNYIYNKWKAGRLNRETYLNNTNDILRVVKSTYKLNTLKNSLSEFTTNMSEAVAFSTDFDITKAVVNVLGTPVDIYHVEHLIYMIESAKLENNTTETTDYLNGKQVSSASVYTYYDTDINKPMNLQSVENILPSGEKIKTSYAYAHEKGNQKLIDANMVGIPLETTTTQTVGTTTKTLSHVETIYPTSVPTTQAGSLLLPLSVKSYDLQAPTTSYTEVTYDQYDSKGNLQQYTTKEGVSVAIIWGYNQTQPIAKVEGATYAQVSSLASAIITASNTDASASANNDESALLTVLDSFRNNSALSGYQVSTYTYDPLIGVRSITPPSGIREYYIYDSANRLEKVVDINGNILKEYKYNYKQ
jgi:hypothetical protein